jgi:cobaltochelatase CobS
MASETETLEGAGEKKAKCMICGEEYHRVDAHIMQKHKMRIAEYRKQFPEAPIMSEHAKRVVEAGRQARIAASKGLPPAAPAPKPEQEGEPAPAPEEAGIYKVGVARLRHNDSLQAGDEVFVPRFDEGWQVGSTEMDLMESLALAIEADEPAMLVGPTGCGKNALVDQLAAVLNQPVTRINLHGDVRAADFLGEKRVEIDPATNQSVVVWKDGALPRAMRNGHWLLLDEMDAAPPAILFVLQSVLEKGHRLVLTGNGGEVVVPHPRFRLIATANTLGRGDNSGLYAGTNILNEAFLDRFGVVVQASYATAEVEAEIIKARAKLPADLAKRMVSVATKVREGMAAEQCYCTFSTRRLIAWATKARRMMEGGMEKEKAVAKAASLSVLNKLDDNDRKVVAGIIQRYFGGEC